MSQTKAQLFDVSVEGPTALKNGAFDVTLGASGNVTISDGNLVVAAGHGIDFSADANAAGMTSELLDDYEEGTFSPFSAADIATHSITIPAQAHYVKIGRNVQVWMRVLFTGATSGQITGNMPFPCSNPTDNGSSSPFFLSAFPDSSLSTNMGFAYLGSNGTTNFGCYKNNDNYPAFAWNSGPSEITITGSYRTT